MRKHTPGPWEILQSDGFLQIASCSDIAKGISSVYARNGVAAMYANAQLIAAAPDLLEALDKLLAATVDEDLKYGITLTEAEEEARALALAAIAKTVGEDDDQ